VHSCTRLRRIGARAGGALLWRNIVASRCTFRYAPPAITSMRPPNLAISLGTTVTLDGMNFGMYLLGPTPPRPDRACT
jgi:hypothetical protein